MSYEFPLNLTILRARDTWHGTCTTRSRVFPRTFCRPGHRRDTRWAAGTGRGRAPGQPTATDPASACRADHQCYHRYKCHHLELNQFQNFEISNYSFINNESLSSKNRFRLKFIWQQLEIIHWGENCQVQVQVPNPLSQQAPNPDPKFRPSLKNPKTQLFGLGLTQ